MKQLHSPNQEQAPTLMSSGLAGPTGPRSATKLQGPRPASRRSRWLGPIAVTLVLFVLSFGGYVVDVPLSDVTASPITVGGDVRLEPLSGWRVAKRSSRNRVVLTRGGGNLEILTASFKGSAEELVTAYLHEFVEPQASQLGVSRTIEQVRLDSGLTGVRVAYLGASRASATQIEGQVTAVVTPTGTGVVFNAWAPRALFAFETNDVDRMIATAKVG